MTPNSKAKDKIRKLFALALDVRGEAAEADSAGLKALQMARSFKVTLGELALVIGEPVEVEIESEPVFADPLGDAIRHGVQSAIENLFGQFNRRR